MSSETRPRNPAIWLGPLIAVREILPPSTEWLDNERMRVVHVIDGRATDDADEAMFRVASGCRELGIDPVVVSFGEGGRTGALARDAGIETLALGARGAFGAAARTFGLASWLRRDRPDVVHAWSHGPAVLAGLAARRVGVPVAWSLRRTALSPEASRLARAAIWTCARLSGRVPSLIACDTAGARSFHETIGHDRGKIRLIENGFDTKLFAPRRKTEPSLRVSLSIDKATTVIGHVGRLRAGAERETLCRAVAAARAAHPDLVLLLGGDGVDESDAALADALASHQLSACTRLIGAHDDMPTVYATLDVLVSCSNSDHAPRAIGEAMACGVPCIVTDTADGVRLVGDCGAVVPAGDAGALGEALAALLAYSAGELRARGRRGRERIEMDFALSRSLDAHVRLYRELAKPP